MKNLNRICLFFAALAISLITQQKAAAQASYTQNVISVFAPGPNLIETEATANTSTNFRTAVATAWTNGNGGVFNFPTGISPNTTTVFKGNYGNGKRIHVTSSANMQNITTGTFTVMSANNGTTTTANNGDYTLTFGLISTNTGLPLSDEVVREIGLPILSRTAAGFPLDLVVTATFTDASSLAVTSNISSGAGVDDTFFGFTAPAGRGIASIRLQSFVPNTTTPVADRIGWDDFGFITGSAVPPPQALSVSPAAFAIANATNGIHFSAMTFSAVNITNISLILNSTNDVSSQLIFSGDPTNYSVSYFGLLPDQEYQMTIGITNPGGSTVYQETFYTFTSTHVFFDSEGFTNDTIYPLGSLQALAHGRGTWVPNASEPAQIVNIGAPQEKVLERQATGISRADFLSFPPVSSGIITFDFDAFVTTTAGRTIDICLQPPSGGNAMASQVAWGQDPGKLSYFDNALWQPVTDLTNDWHHVKLIHYLSGPAGGTYDVLINGIPVGLKILWRNTAVGTAFNLFRIQTQDTAAIVQSGRIDNLLVTVGPEDPNVFAAPFIGIPNVATNAIVHPTNNTVQFTVSSGIPIYTTNITVLLDSNNISGSLVLTGPETNRTVTYSSAGAGNHLLEIHAASSAGSSARLQRFIVTDEPWLYHPADGWVSPWQWSSGFPALSSSSPLDGAGPFAQLNTTGAPNARNLMREYQSGTVNINLPHYIRWKFRMTDPDFLANYTSADDRVHFFAHPVSRLTASTTGGNSWAITGSGGVNMGVTTNQAFYIYDNVDGSSAFTPINHVNSGILVVPDHIYSFEVLVQPAQTNYLVKIVDETDSLMFTSAAPHRFRDLTGATHTFLHFGIQASPTTDVRSFDLDSVSVVQAALPPTPVVLINPVRSGADFSFSFASQNGVNYTAQYVSDIASTNWTTLQSVSGDGGLKTVTHTNPPAAHLFYRVSIP